jgi:hypothetical protein
MKGHLISFILHDYRIVAAQKQAKAKNVGKESGMKITKDNFFTTSDGAHLYFEDTGEGTPLVMVPGFLCTTRFFSRNTPELSKHCRVVAVDPRGQGRSSKTLTGNNGRAPRAGYQGAARTPRPAAGGAAGMVGRVVGGGQLRRCLS